MSTSLAVQLHQIAAKSTNSLNLKAQRTSHAQSLIFEPKLAATQDFDTIFQICQEGFEELCLLDPRFVGFGRSIFSEQSKTQDRTQMTARENDGLNKTLDDFMDLVGGRLLLKPAVKAMDWLVRRFRVHEYNVSSLLLTFLPYHTTAIFPTVLSILPSRIPLAFKFLHPYIKSLISPPRHTIVYSATNNLEFFAALNSHVLRVSKARVHYRALLSFWVGIVTEGVAGMLDNTRSGRGSKERQNQQDVLLRILPFLNEALAIEKVPDLRIGCYMLMTILVSKSGLEDTVLVKMMEAVTAGWTHDTRTPALVCLSIMAQERRSTKLPRTVFKAIMSIDYVEDELLTLSLQCRVDRLTLGLMLGCIRRLGKIQDTRGLRFVKRMLHCSILDESQISNAVEAILGSAQDFDITLTNGTELQSQLADLLARLTDSEAISGITEKVVQGSSMDIENLEARLQIVLSAPDRSVVEPAKDDSISNPPSKAKDETFEKAIASIPTRTAYEVSFLSCSKSYVFGSLSHAFIVSAMSPSNLKIFTELPVLRKGLALSEPLYFTFFVRIWCGQYPVLARTAALQVVSEYFSKTDNSTVDVQALLSYILVALADSSAKVRRAASELLLQLGRLYKTLLEKESNEIKVWGVEDIHGQGEEAKSISWLSVKSTATIIDKIFLPGLEEFVLDREHISRSLEHALGKSTHTGHPGSKAASAEVKKSLRVAFLMFLGGHIITTPLYAVKLRLLRVLERVEKVGTSSRTKALLPLLHSWVSTNDIDVGERCKAEGIDRAEMDRAIVAVVLPSDRDGVHMLQSIMKREAGTTSLSLIKAANERISTIWPRIRADMQPACVETLFALSLDSSTDSTSHQIQNLAMDTLRSIQLPTNILVTMVDNLPTAASFARDRPRPTKRRRMSNGQTAAVNLHGTKELTAALQKITFVLELVESSRPEKHPELMPSLFRILAELPLLRSQVESELAYLQNLILGSLLALVGSFKSGAAQAVDRAAVRVDLLVDCVRATANPQVQQTALLLIADLARVAPELILHSIMPIFTFMGASVLRQDDEYSAYVINRTINEVVPPLVEAMKKHKRDALSGSSELLLSFVAAFEHIPWHRRYPLFESLVDKLGPEGFLFALLGLLADRYAAKKDVQDFALGLAARFSAKVQLVTVHKYLELVFDALRPKRTTSDIFLSIGPDQGRSPPEVALNLLKLVPHLLGAKHLVSAVSKSLQQNDKDAADVRSMYSSILQQTLGLAQQNHDQKQLSSTCGLVLETLLALLSTPEFLKSTKDLLDDPDPELRRKFLRSLEVRIRSDRASNHTSRDALLQFLPELTIIITKAPEVLLKLAALECVDQISERFGKKNIGAIADAAKVISSAQCLGHADNRLCTLALLCLTSMVEVLDQDILPMLPEALPRAYEHLRKSIDEGIENERLHNAVYTFISALLMHVPWIITGGYLDSILKLSYESSNAEMGQSCDYSRKETLQLFAKQTNAKDLFLALERSWSAAVTEGPQVGTLCSVQDLMVTKDSQAVMECLDILSIAIEKQPKSSIVGNSTTLSGIFMGAFDLRRIVSTAQIENDYDDAEIEMVETAIGDVAIKMVYKLNDATFRPLFTSLLEWASTGLPKRDKQGQRLRLTSLFAFLQIFFGGLKSIVTSYASHVIDIAVNSLQDADLKTSDSVALSRGVLRTLHAAFEHDQDDFWQSPSHFKAICDPLLSQLRHASSATSLASDAIPAITELAAAADSADNHKEMNATIMKEMRSDEAHVRLAAVKCEQSLTARLGEEWLALLPEMLPFISELQEDDDEVVERETNRFGYLPSYEDEYEDATLSNLKNAMTRQDMSPARKPGQSLKIDVPDGAAQSRPPTAAVFLIYFDHKAGYTISWQRSIKGVELEGVVEFKSLPSGLHNVKEDLIYFVHEQYAGLSAFVNEAADESERNALMLAVGVLVPLSYGRLGRSWRHAQDLKDMASLLAQDITNTQPLEDYWEAHRMHDNGSPTQPGSPIASPSSLKSKPTCRQFSNGHARNRTSSDATALELPGQNLSPFHPALSLPEFIDTFGPLIFPLYRAALLRKRILLIGQAPVELNCNYVYDLSIISNIPIPVQNLHSLEAFSVRLRPLFAIGVHDIPILEQKPHGNDSNESNHHPVDDEVSGPEDSGWVACSTDDVLAMKSSLYDVLVTMPPAYSKQAKEKVWPTVESPRGTAVKATQRDLRRYRILRRGLRYYQTDDIHVSPDAENGDDEVSMIAQRPEETFDDDSSTNDERLIEPMSWPALAYTSFMWWASAGEKRADLDEEVERDAALLHDYWASNASPSERSRPSPKSNIESNEENSKDVMSEMALIAYFHRLTTLAFTTLADIVDCCNADAGVESEEEVLTINGEDIARMGLDIWSDGDRKFIKDLVEMYFGRKADVQGAKVDCCGVRIC